MKPNKGDFLRKVIYQWKNVSHSISCPHFLRNYKAWFFNYLLCVKVIKMDGHVKTDRFSFDIIAIFEVLYKNHHSPASRHITLILGGELNVQIRNHHAWTWRLMNRLLLVHIQTCLQYYGRLKVPWK